MSHTSEPCNDAMRYGNRIKQASSASLTSYWLVSHWSCSRQTLLEVNLEREGESEIEKARESQRKSWFGWWSTVTFRRDLQSSVNIFLPDCKYIDFTHLATRTLKSTHLTSLDFSQYCEIKPKWPWRCHTTRLLDRIRRPFDPICLEDKYC